MQLAIVNKKTNVVENVVIPPSGAQAWFVGIGFTGVESADAAIGDVYNSETGEFIKPQTEAEEEAVAAAEAKEG